ncbi:uncharacterized protein LOC127779565 [Oryza glaberrima]|uniref:uncharacterized protein LOC127779565 n=1 Tax=Oryza glaberrima TaxID=4538 RepID=UPI00224C258F|nr:uncharacterized protein LOC127779565 [Oryza glaberrima]
MHRLPSRSRRSPLLSFALVSSDAATSFSATHGMVSPNPPPARRVLRFPWEPRFMTTISRVKGNESGKPYRRPHISSANVIIPSQDKKDSVITQGMKNIDIKGTISEVIDGDEKTDKDVAASEVIYINYDILGQTVKHDGFGDEGQRSKAEEHMGGIVLSDDKEVIDDEEFIVNDVLPESRHHDGSIYRDMDMWWKRDYHIADRNETRLEAMRYSNTTHCIIHVGTCCTHSPCSMLQILSLELVKLRVDGGLVELYGYIAVRDDLDPLLNYIVNVSRDDPIIVEQGSLINMAGPKRGIDMMDYALIEYDMRIKTGEQEKDDIQLIDGASLIGPAGLWDEPYAIHLPGDYGVVEITLSRLCWAVEATVEVVILEVKSSFDLLLGCLTSGLDKEIRLFDDTITEPCGLKRSVVAVSMNSLIELNFKVGTLSSSFDQRCCSFKPKIHGHDTQEINTAFALILVKVTWSTLLL